MKAYIYDQLREAVPWKVRAWFKNQPWFTPVTKALLGADVYSESYFAMIERNEKHSVDVIASWLVENLQLRTAVDVGCGPGHLMQALEARGVATFGVDIAKAALRIGERKGLKVQFLDLRRGEPMPGAPYDLVVCCEVAEHLDEEYAPQLVRTLTQAGKAVFLTAAEHDPLVGPGLHHVNEQPNDYWIGLMEAEGWRLDRQLTESARGMFADNNVILYLRKAMVFVSGDSSMA